MALLRVLFVMLVVLPVASISSPVPSPDAVTLFAFKSACAGRAAVAALSSWTGSSDPCSGRWRGITCQHSSSSSSSSPPRVRRVVLEGLRLGGDAAVVAVLAGLPLLSFLSLKNNSFTGSLRDVDLSPLAPHLKLLYLSDNGFSGRFPESILRLRHLRRLDLSGNRLTGTIPSEIGHRLRALLTLHLARNAFVGPVPASLEAMTKLTELSVSGNNLKGEIPKHLAAAFPVSSFTGNPDLCGAPLRRRCIGQQQRVHVGGDGETPHRRRRNHDRWMVVMIMVAVGAAVALTLIAAALYTALWLKNKEPTSTRPRASSRTRTRLMSREETVRFDGCCDEFDVRTLMMGAAEMLGKGAAATTYRVVMGGGDDAHGTGVEVTRGEAVVVKRLRRRQGATREDERRSRELAREMGSWRHDNIVNLRAFYASAEELLLVFDYVPNGSLHSLLHENRGPARVPLEWQTRLKLAQDAARGLTYLHGVSGSGLSHRHLTSSNILIDAGGNARVSDFALLQLLAPEPPEQAQEDVRCFGVILLEILTGRSPEDGSAGGDMPRWVRTVVREEWTSEVFDVELLRTRGAEDEMVTLLQVALLCVADDPAERPKMAVVSRMIEDIRERGSKRSKCSASASASPSQVGHSYESSPCGSEDTARSTTASSS